MGKKALQTGQRKSWNDNEFHSDVEELKAFWVKIFWWNGSYNDITRLKRINISDRSAYSKLLNIMDKKLGVIFLRNFYNFIAKYVNSYIIKWKNSENFYHRKENYSWLKLMTKIWRIKTFAVNKCN